MSLTQQGFTFRCASSPSWPSGGHENDRLCDECAKIDLEQSFARAFALYEGARRDRNTQALQVYRSVNGPPYLGYFYYVTSLADRLSGVAYCKLCKFLRQTIANPEKGTYKLLAICSSESYLFEPPKKDTHGRPEERPWGEFEHNIFMAVVPEVPLIPKTAVPLRWFETDLPKSGSIYRLTRSKSDETRLVLPRDLRAMAEFDVLKLWLDLCRDTHACCAPKKAAGASLPSFRAINCTKTPPVVEERPWSESYVALSYVWGPPSGDWPRTILDAVEVTKRLGEKYLWVDRLCINQSNLQEKQFLISKMDAIYEGAEFTIIAAVGEARTGLPGVTRPRKPQPRVELRKYARTANGALANKSTSFAPDPYFQLLGITKEEYEETCKDRKWLDVHRHGLRSKGIINLSGFMKDQEIMETYNISQEHLRLFQDFADDFENSIDEMMIKMKQMAGRMGLPLKELVPHLLSQTASRAGLSLGATVDLTSIPPRPVTSPSRRERPLPSGKIAGRTILISTLEDPRITISNSEWATRGWTYQEGVLSNRRLVFTEKQVYWECRGMAINESLDLPLVNLYDRSGTRMADYMLSGIFDADLHRVPELQYGFKTSVMTEISDQIQKLDSHIHAFTSRSLSYDSDSLNAFLGIAVQYSNDNGLCLLLGVPVFAGLFANGEPGLQDTFALSISTWTHAAPRMVEDAEIYVTDCRQRAQFPSWTWAGWNGQADFSDITIAGEDEDRPVDSIHVDFFTAMTSKSWVDGINHLWSAKMMLHTTDGSVARLLTGRASIVDMADPNKTWLLTIREPLVFRHMYLVHTATEDESRRLMGKQVQLHFSVPITEAELTSGHKSGELVTVPVFASTVPFVFNGIVRCLILRKVSSTGTRWKRIGRLVMMLEEWEMDRYKSTAEIIAGLPVKKFGREMVLI